MRKKKQKKDNKINEKIILILVLINIIILSPIILFSTQQTTFQIKKDVELFGNNFPVIHIIFLVLMILDIIAYTVLKLIYSTRGERGKYGSDVELKEYLKRHFYDFKNKEFLFKDIRKNIIESSPKRFGYPEKKLSRILQELIEEGYLKKREDKHPITRNKVYYYSKV